MNAIDKAKMIKFQFPMLEVSVVGKWIWVSGDTRPQAAGLKTAGLKFSKNKSKWYWAGEGFKPRRAKTIPYPSIVMKYGEARVQMVPAETATAQA
jgi:hypothetical protein